MFKMSTAGRGTHVQAFAKVVDSFVNPLMGTGNYSAQRII